MTAQAATTAIETRGVGRAYSLARQIVRAVHDVDLCVRVGETVAIMGPSGSGKSTLLGMIGGLDRPTSGAICVAGEDITGYSRHDLAIFRRTTIGYISQSPSLLPMLTVEENIALPLTLIGMDETERRIRVFQLLESVELTAQARSLPEELSGGQQQRVSLARALAVRPPVLLADEPVGSLDTATAKSVLRLLSEAAHEENSALLLVTHEREEAEIAGRILTMKDGVLAGEEIIP